MDETRSWGALAGKFKRTTLTEAVLAELLGLDEDDSASLLGELQEARIKTVGTLLTAAEKVTEQDDGTFKATGKLSDVEAGFLQDIAALRDKVSCALAVPRVEQDGLMQLMGGEYDTLTELTLEGFKARLAADPPARCIPVTATMYIQIQKELPACSPKLRTALEAFYADNHSVLPSELSGHLQSLVTTAFTNDVQGEAGLHGSVDAAVTRPLVVLLRDVLGITDIRSARDTAQGASSFPTSLERVRPDMSLFVGRLLAFKVEEKGNAQYLQAALDELVDKMPTWYPVFTGGLSFLLGMAFAGTNARLVALTPLGGKTISTVLHSYNAALLRDRLSMWIDMVRVARALQAMYTATLGKPMIKLGEKLSTRNDSYVVIEPECVEKFSRTVSFKHAKAVFERVEKYQPRHVVRLLQNTSVTACRGREREGWWRAKLVPVGGHVDQANDLEALAKFVDNVLSGLHELHSMGIVHLDVRLRNILWHPSSKSWFLIDVDEGVFLTQDGTTGPFTRPPRFAQVKSWSPKDDLEQFAAVVRSSLIGLSAGQVVCDQLADKISAASSAQQALTDVKSVLAQARRTERKRARSSSVERIGSAGASASGPARSTAPGEQPAVQRLRRGNSSSSAAAAAAAPVRPPRGKAGRSGTAVQ